MNRAAALRSGLISWWNLALVRAALEWTAAEPYRSVGTCLALVSFARYNSHSPVHALYIGGLSRGSGFEAL